MFYLSFVIYFLSLLRCQYCQFKCVFPPFFNLISHVTWKTIIFFSFNFFHHKFKILLLPLNLFSHIFQVIIFPISCLFHYFVLNITANFFVPFQFFRFIHPKLWMKKKHFLRESLEVYKGINSFCMIFLFFSLNLTQYFEEILGFIAKSQINQQDGMSKSGNTPLKI